MVKRTTVTRVTSILLLATCGAWCQEENPSAGLPQGAHFDDSNVPDMQRQELRAQRSLPDAPSAQRPTPAEKFHAFVENARSPLNFGAAGVHASVIPDKGEHLAPGMQPRFTAFYEAAMLRKESSTFLDKYLYRLLLKHDSRYHPSTSDSTPRRAAYGVSRVLTTRNDSGKTILNTSYLLGVLTSAAVATANRPYWARCPSTTFNNFGSTIGSDVGINFFHEFQPNIQQMLNSHSPKFVKRIEGRIIKDATLTEIVSPAGVVDNIARSR